MSAPEQDIIVSDLPDLSGLPLAADARLDDDECMRILRRAAGGGGAGTLVSAFNSSI